MNEEQRTSILQMARGAIQERADYEMARILDNILDPNTEARAKRKLQLTIDFRPDDDRQVIAVSVTAKSALCPTNPVSTSLYITGDECGEATAVEMIPNIPGQTDLFGSEQGPAAVLRLAKNA